MSEKPDYLAEFEQTLENDIHKRVVQAFRKHRHADALIDCCRQIAEEQANDIEEAYRPRL